MRDDRDDRQESPAPVGRAKLFASLAVVLMLSSVAAEEESLRVEIDGNAVSVGARAVAVEQVLEEIGRKTGLTVDLRGSLDERITLLAKTRVFNQEHYVVFSPRHGPFRKRVLVLQ